MKRDRKINDPAFKTKAVQLSNERDNISELARELELKSKRQLQNAQHLLKKIRMVNPFAEYLELPQSVFKPRRTNSFESIVW